MYATRSNYSHFSDCFPWALAFLLSTCGIAEARIWTDASGKFSVDAEFISLEEGIVSLKKPNGVIAALPIENLSGADQDYVKSLTTASSEAPSEKDNSRKQANETASTVADMQSTETEKPVPVQVTTGIFVVLQD